MVTNRAVSSIRSALGWGSAIGAFTQLVFSYFTHEPIMFLNCWEFDRVCTVYFPFDYHTNALWMVKFSPCMQYNAFTFKLPTNVTIHGYGWITSHVQFQPLIAFIGNLCCQSVRVEAGVNIRWELAPRQREEVRRYRCSSTALQVIAPRQREEVMKYMCSSTALQLIASKIAVETREVFFHSRAWDF